MGGDASTLADRMLAGDRMALARLMTLVEARTADVPAVMAKIYPRLGRAHVTGITGPPGAGKSTLVDRMTGHLRAQGRRVGVVAVDPSSPFSGGAVLGDRIRMQSHFLDSGVFIRSLSTRGSHGGIPRAARDVVRLLDAFGMDDVLVETVGVGQTELDIMRLADTVVVVLVPEAGDAVQVMKAGLLEIADVFVVNKSDREGADRLLHELGQMLGMRGAGPWTVPTLRTEARSGAGTEAVVTAVAAHRAHLAADAERGRRALERREGEVLDILDEEIHRRLRTRLETDGVALRAVVESVRTGTLDPYTAAVRVLADPATLADLLAEDRRRG
jgi:GTPase